MQKYVQILKLCPKTTGLYDTRNRLHAKEPPTGKGSAHITLINYLYSHGLLKNEKANI